MKLSLEIPSIILLIILICNNLIPTSAHFCDHDASFVKTDASIPKKSAWNYFHNLTKSHKGEHADGLHTLKKYFKYFGYLNSTDDDLSDDFDGNFEWAVKKYQRNFRINTTGELDDSTLHHIVQPRCGNPDIVNGKSTMIKKQKRARSRKFPHIVSHYAFFANHPRWNGNLKLKYAFQPKNNLSAEVKAIFGRAFAKWAQVAPLTFTETTSLDDADINIEFFTKDHGDGEPFDGLLGMLAHAFAPPNGRFHLDAEENWVTDGSFTNKPDTSMDLESVAVHEIGHLLGMGHSAVEASIMYPSISPKERKVDLHADDIEGIQELYGPNPNYKKPAASTAAPASAPALSPR